MVVYYETLCPDCRQYLSLMAFPTFVMLDDIMSLTVVPYGNARVGSEVYCLFFFQFTLNFNYHKECQTLGKEVHFIQTEFTAAISPFQEKHGGHKYVFECQHGEQECLANMVQVKLQTNCTDFC